MTKQANFKNYWIKKNHSPSSCEVGLEGCGRNARLPTAPAPSSHHFKADEAGWVLATFVAQDWSSCKRAKKLANEANGITI